MRIRPYRDFKHAGTIYGDVPDPRRDSFHETDIVVDLRECEFVRPPAVLWCVVYPLLARSKGADCTLLVPESMAVCRHLKSLGLFETLKEHGVEVDDRGVSQGQTQRVIIPLTKLESEFQMDHVTNNALEALSESGLGSPNIHPDVSEVFAELSSNAIQHSESPVDAYGIIQYFEFQQGNRFVCAVGDGGIGIRRSLENNPDLRDRVPYDWVAIELALRERVSGTGNKTRGIGLFSIAEDARKANRQLIIHSGLGMVEIREDVQSEARRSRLFPGTLGYTSIPT